MPTVDVAGQLQAGKAACAGSGHASKARAVLAVAYLCWIRMRPWPTSADVGAITTAEVRPHARIL